MADDFPSAGRKLGKSLISSCLENPMVCNQDGFHVMNGHEAINLTTEANLICHTDYVHDLTDKCPTRKDMPVRPPCCQSQMRMQ